jgi:hypothetical protein
MIELLSLGAGVQSSTVLLMSCKGDLPKLDHAIFADTRWEPESVYQWLHSVLVPACTKAGIQFHYVSKGNIRDDALRSRMRGKKDDEGNRWASMPWYVKTEGKTTEGQIRRQCTSEYKIFPIEKKIREIIGLKPRQHWPKTQMVRKWFGISHDEMQRMRISQRPAISFYYPLIEKRLTRGHCLEWLQSHGYEKAPRSACIGCPYRSNSEWRALPQNEFTDAVIVDHAIRTAGGRRGKTYTHRDCVPLDQVNLDDPHENQFSFLDECEGMCGV